MEAQFHQFLMATTHENMAGDSDAYIDGMRSRLYDMQLKAGVIQRHCCVSSFVYTMVYSDLDTAD